ncbi:MAG: hypothetical protein KC442_00875 [Thermomicrobiales bacterium]|nr:hypothetical protein [Thermomicrobiales bacterium]
MDYDRFDQFARALSRPPSRRMLAGMLSLGALGLAGGGQVNDAGARKKKKKNVKKNVFGCVDVGKHCQNAGQCCSGICQGKKGKKKCKAHGESTCVSGQSETGCGGTSVACQTPSGDEGQCDTTTGNAGYCVADGLCFACKKDADCVSQCGADAACIQCAGPNCALQGGTACVGPEADSCVPPPP